MSHRIGRVGFIERENATIMNSSLGYLANKVVTSFNVALNKLKIKKPFCLKIIVQFLIIVLNFSCDNKSK